MKKVMTVVGARPQIIKSAALSRCIQNHFQSRITEILVHTGQHYSDNMSALHFDQMGLKRPDVIMDLSNQTHVVSRLAYMIQELGAAIQTFKPHLVLVYGDTDSTLAAALAAEMCGVPIAHVEAGLRSHRRDMPEERNRILTDHLSAYLFAPTAQAEEQLKYEMLNRTCHIIQSGDIMLDNALHFRGRTERPASLPSFEQPMALFTAHRADTMENEQRFLAMCKSVEIILQTHDVIWPMHPRTRNQMQLWMSKDQISKLMNNPKLHCIEPFGYLDTLWTIEHADVVCTDSGGLQKEAAFYGKPVLILRDETEWIELLDKGIATLTGLDHVKIASAMANLPRIDAEQITCLFGNGESAKIICEAILEETEK